MNNLRKKLGNNSFHNRLKIFKYLGTKLMKKMKGLYAENYKSLKKVNEDIRKWKGI
jgi:hypothetical protein